MQKCVLCRGCLHLYSLTKSTTRHVCMRLQLFVCLCTCVFVSRLSAELLRLLCPVPCVQEQVCQCEGVPVLLSMLHADDLKLLWSVVWVLVQLCQDPHTSALIRTWGGVQQLLHILHGSAHLPYYTSSIITRQVRMCRMVAWCSKVLAPCLVSNQLISIYSGVKKCLPPS